MAGLFASSLQQPTPPAAVAEKILDVVQSGTWKFRHTSGPDADGYLQLVARIKELINRGGEKISPREIDEVLVTHPAIAEAVCFGVPHPTWGEEVSAAVVLKGEATESDILSFCKERLADFKRPKKIHIVETIPRTATGKIQRKAVATALVGGAK